MSMLSTVLRSASRSGSSGCFGNHLPSIPYAFYRSGTSRGVYLLEEDVAAAVSGDASPPVNGATPTMKIPDEKEEREKRDKFYASIMGSGHPQQLNGFGGGVGVTSKLVVVGTQQSVGDKLSQQGKTPDDKKESATGGTSNYKEAKAEEEQVKLTFTFKQCKVDVEEVDHSHGDCGNMIAAVLPFAFERGLIAVSSSSDNKDAYGSNGNSNPSTTATAPSTITVPIVSQVTGAEYTAEVQLDSDGHVLYTGGYVVPGVPYSGAPITISTLNVAGAQTKKLLPTNNVVDTVRLDLSKLSLAEGSLLSQEGLELMLGASAQEQQDKDVAKIDISVVDFARCLITIDGEQLFDAFRRLESAADEKEGNAVASTKIPSTLHATLSSPQNLDELRKNKSFHVLLERIRRTVSMQIGMGNCTEENKDAPKVAIVGKAGAVPDAKDTESSSEKDAAAMDQSMSKNQVIESLYYVNPHRSEMHPTYAMTAAQAVAAAASMEKSVVGRILKSSATNANGGESSSMQTSCGNDSLKTADRDVSLLIRHAKGELPVTVGLKNGKPFSGKYTTTVKPIAEGRTFLQSSL